MFSIAKFDNVIENKIQLINSKLNYSNDIYSIINRYNGSVIVINVINDALYCITILNNNVNLIVNPKEIPEVQNKFGFIQTNVDEFKWITKLKSLGFIEKIRLKTDIDRGKIIIDGDFSMDDKELIELILM